MLRRITMLAGVVVIAAACSWGGEDDANSVTGPGVVVHCDALGRRVPATPRGIGDTTVKTACPGSVEAQSPAPVQLVVP